MLPIKDKITVVTAGHGSGHGSGLAETAVVTALVIAVIAVIAVIEVVAVAVTAREQPRAAGLAARLLALAAFRAGAQASVLIGATLRGRCDRCDRDFGSGHSGHSDRLIL